MHATCADMQIYQFLYHLGSAHLCSEPLAVGVHNCITIHDMEHAGVKGFPKEVKDIGTMARVLAIIIWTLTGYHSMSFAVEHIDAYIPFRSPCL